MQSAITLTCPHTTMRWIQDKRKRMLKANMRKGLTWKLLDTKPFTQGITEVVAIAGEWIIRGAIPLLAEL